MLSFILLFFAILGTFGVLICMLLFVTDILLKYNYCVNEMWTHIQQKVVVIFTTSLAIIVSILYSVLFYLLH